MPGAMEVIHMRDEEPEVVEDDAARRHREMVAAFEASPWCRSVGPPDRTTVIFLSSPEVLAAFKKALGRS